MALTEILETIARDGLEGPRDLDVAIEAIFACYDDEVLDEDNLDALADLLEDFAEIHPRKLDRAERDCIVDMINEIFLRK